MVLVHRTHPMRASDSSDGHGAADCFGQQLCCLCGGLYKLVGQLGLTLLDIVKDTHPSEHPHTPLSLFA